MTTISEGSRTGQRVEFGSEPVPIVANEYYSPEFAAREWDAVWTRVWQIAGRAEQLSEPGDFITCELGRESILCVLGNDGRIRAFYNVCQHRGNLLAMAEEGTLASGEFECTYHGWRFNTLGTLTAVTCEEDFLQGSPCGRRNLVEMPCETFAGFIWFNMDPDAVPLAEYLGPVQDGLEPYQMDRMRRTHWVTVEADLNWKVVQDNFNETYHVVFVHPHVDGAMETHYSGCPTELLVPTGHALQVVPTGPGERYEGTAERVYKSLKADLEFWEIDFEEHRHDLRGIRGALQRQRRALGASKGYDFSSYSDAQLTDHFHYTVFPNLSLSMIPDGCLLLRATPHPTNPEKCLFDMWYMTLFPEGATTYYSNYMREWIGVDEPVPHQVGRAGELSCGREVDQDIAIWETQQRGLRSRGYRDTYYSNQECRVQYFHNTLHEYLNRAE